MKTLNRILCILLLLAFARSGFALQKILVITETNCYNSCAYQINRYIQDIINIDNKHAQLITWTPTGSTNVGMCDPLFHQLQTEYTNAINSGDVLEGAVLIGDVPVPQTIHSNPGDFYMPVDQIYMDIIDTRTNPPSPYSPCPYISGNYYAINPSGSDGICDIWISRINAHYLNGQLRQGAIIYDEYTIYQNYLTRVCNRMELPATVPSRGFAMGGPVNFVTSYPLHTNLTTSMMLLNLPWLAEFTGGHNSSFNWMSQLLAGPRGCITYGAFNGHLFPQDDRNARYCRYSQFTNNVYLPGNNNPTTQLVDSDDSLGLEWAGVYGHSCPEHTNFNSDGNGNIECILNGQFTYGTYGPFWGSSYYQSTGGLNGGFYWYQDFQNQGNNPENPYNSGLGWKGKSGEWRWPVSTNNDYTYDIYMYYSSVNHNASQNCPYAGGFITDVTLDADGVPYEIASSRIPYNVDQRTNWGTWVRIGTGITLNHGHMAIVSIYNYDPVAGVAYSGNLIADAVCFHSTTPGSSVNDIVYTYQPASYPESDNQPFTVFSTPGFIRNDEVNRTYEDMGDEPGGSGFCKSQFFLMNACSINNFLSPWSPDPNCIMKCLGNMYALGHNGLISMGAATDDNPAVNKIPFCDALAAGKDFGEAFLAQQNSVTTKVSYPYYSLLGAGTLRSQPYVQYGSLVVQDLSITSPFNYYSYNPILIKNVTVSGAGSLMVNSINNMYGSPKCTHSEIVIRPECDFAPTGTNEVHFIAN